MMIADTDPWVGDGGGLNDAQAMWRERERRQRSVRFFMMFLLMMLLMDGEEQNQRRRSHDGNLMRKKSKSQKETHLARSLYSDRRDQDKLIQQTAQRHPRYKYLIERNQGRDHDSEIRNWAEAQLDLEKDEFGQIEELRSDQKEQQAEEKAFHFPWNTTGFYRGEWTRDKQYNWEASENHSFVTEKEQHSPRKEETVIVNATDIEDLMLRLLEEKNELMGVYLLPSGIKLKMQNDSALADSNVAHPLRHSLLRGAPTPTHDETSRNLRITLTKPSGRVAFQLYSRSVPGIKEISLLDGFVKLYDSNTVGYSTRRDLLLRVSGLSVHSIGKLFLVSNSSPGRSAFVIDKLQNDDIRRRLLEALEEPNTGDKGIFHSSLTSIDQPFIRRRLDGAVLDNSKPDSNENTNNKPANLVQSESDALETRNERSRFVRPRPFVTDDEEQSIRHTRTPAARVMPPREHLLEANAGGCEFEIAMDIQENEWEVSKWRRLVGKQTADILAQNPSLQDDTPSQGDNMKNRDGTKIIIGKSSTASKSLRSLQYQSLAMTMNGTITSPNCNFTAYLNTTALRTDWEHTTGRAINYAFYMMLTCLTQIVLLLRQLLHTQAQSAATRVSLLCIGWQTLLDAILCLIHIYLSLATQPVFTAFVSVAFFKLLICCVIEMKYMAIIIQARNANVAGNSTELLRRQIAMLHLRFYVALLFAFIIFFYAWELYRRLYMLLLYSFWIPQIIQNVVTEAKRPLHHYYVYGMSFTRLVAPLFVFFTRGNFLKEIYPDIPTDAVLCYLLILWVGFQTAILEAQGRFGARFFIPLRFLPPKFDYSRPIPASMLPPGDHELLTPSESLKNERNATQEVRPLLPRDTSLHIASGGTRNRIKGSRANRTEASMTSETMTSPCHHPSLPSFDCVICYNNIDIRNRRGYMLAPCDHIFHRECLTQWMEVKMECPVCRTTLPAL